MAFTDGSTVAFTVAGTTYRYNLASSQGSAGIWTVQNVTPTFTQAKAGDALDNEVQPFAEESFSDWTGSMGLYESSDDAGDLTRPFFTSLDNSRPRQLTGYPFAFGAFVTVAAPGVQITLGSFQWVDAAVGPGFVALPNGGAPPYHYFTWNATTKAWDHVRTVNGTPATGGDFAAANRAVTGTLHQPFLTVQQFGSALWMANAAGLTNINLAAAAPAGAGAITNIVGTVKFFDQLVTLAVRNKNLEVVCLNDSGGDATLAVTQSIGPDGVAFNNICKIYGETVLMGAVALNGTLFVFTDKSLYALQWIEATKVFVVEPLIVGTGIFTSNPCVFQSELYIGSKNQLWHWTPGQGNNDYKPIDPTGWLPSPYNGTITEVHPFTQVLAVKVAEKTGALFATGTYFRYTALGAWQNIAPGDVTDPSSPLLCTQDGTNAATLQQFTGNFNTRAVSIFESGENIRNLPTGQATANPGILVTPWRYGANRSAQKQYLRDRWEVEAASNGSWTGYYQTDLENKSVDSPSFSAYIGGTGLGTWHRASPTMLGSTAADASSALDGSGNGVLWTEHDGSNGADWHGSVAYPSYKRIRFLYQTDGSYSTASPAVLLSHAYQRLEYAFKFYVINTTIHLEINMDHPTNPYSAITTPALLMAEVSRIQGWDYGKSIITVVGPDNVSYPSVITKYLANVTKMQPNGVWSVDLSLTLQCVRLFGLAI